MGCCQTRQSKINQDFYTIGLSYIETKTHEKQTFDNCPVDKIVLRCIDQLQDDESCKKTGVNIKTLENLNDLFCINPSTLKINVLAQNHERKVNLIHHAIIDAFEKYRIKLNMEYADMDLGEHKQVLIGKRWTKEAALAQLDFVVYKINLLFNNRQYKLNPECDPLWYNLPQVCLELIVDAPFLMDLLKSEVYDWEVNDYIYTSESSQGDPSLGFYQGFVSEILYQRQFAGLSNYDQQNAYLPGRLSDQMMLRLKAQYDSQGGSKMQNYRILFPSVSLVYKSIYQAEVFLQKDAESSKAPRAIFKIKFQQDNDKNGFLCYQDITMNETDQNMCMVNRLQLEVLQVSQRVDGLFMIESKYLPAQKFDNIKQWRDYSSENQSSETAPKSILKQKKPPLAPNKSQNFCFGGTEAYHELSTSDGFLSGPSSMLPAEQPNLDSSRIPLKNRQNQSSVSKLEKMEPERAKNLRKYL